MKLDLNGVVLNSHSQKYSNSCVPMGIELVLKLMGQAEKDYYELQDEKGDTPSWGGDYDNKTIKGTLIKMNFDILRGTSFPLDDLFKTIYKEINAGRFVNCAWRKNSTDPYHAYVIYGYEGAEFLAITKYHNNAAVFYIDDMKSKLTSIQGSDILTFTIV